MSKWAVLLDIWQKMGTADRIALGLGCFILGYLAYEITHTKSEEG